MAKFLFILVMSTSCFSQQLHRQTFHGGIALSANGISLTGEAMNRSTTVDAISLSESILYQLAHDEALSTDEINVFESSLNVFPNPVISELNFTHESIASWKVTVFDSSGKIVMNIPDAHDSVDLTHLSEGQYYVAFGNGQSKIVKKIIKR